MVEAAFVFVMAFGLSLLAVSAVGLALTGASWAFYHAWRGPSVGEGSRYGSV